MKQEDIGLLAERIARGVPQSSLSVSVGRLFRSYLRRLGDEIDEPIIADEKDAPQYFIRVPISVGGGDPVVVAVSPEAAQKILARL